MEALIPCYPMQVMSVLAGGEGALPELPCADERKPPLALGLQIGQTPGCVSGSTVAALW